MSDSVSYYRKQNTPHNFPIIEASLKAKVFIHTKRKYVYTYVCKYRLPPAAAVYTYIQYNTRIFYTAKQHDREILIANPARERIE